MPVEKLKLSRVVLLGATSWAAMCLANGEAEAQSQSQLPPVTVDAPKPRQARPVTQSRTTAARTVGRRTAARAPQATPAPTIPTTNPNSTLTAPPAFPGGQVATGSQLGFLGNVSVFDAPFNTISYTAKTIEDHQARSIADVFANNPSVRAPAGSDGVYDNFMVRGFPVTAAAFMLNGLPGIAPAQKVSPYFIDRLEITNGPSGLLNNMPLFGSVGATINIVPKRATDAPITAVSANFQSDGQPGTHVDVGRRYGEHNEWGVRFNGAFQDGKIFSEQAERLGLAAIALDYRGDRFRFALDAGYQNQKTDRPLLSMLYNGPAGPVLEPPKAGTNPFQPWSYNHATDAWVMGRGEYDVTSNVTAYAAAGYKTDRSLLFSSYQEIEDRAGNTTVYPYYEPYSTKNVAAETGVRARFDTGFVTHRTNVAYALQQAKIGFSDTFFPDFASNIYSPTIVPAPSIAGISNDPPIGNTNNLSSFAVSDQLSVLNDRAILILGGRYQSIKTANFDEFGVQTRNYDEARLTPAVGVVVKPLSNVSLYANYIEGLSPGPTAPSGTTNAFQTFAPVLTKQKEAGVKVDWGGWATTISGFEITQPNGFTDPITNTFAVFGEQRNRGVEFNLFGLLSPGVRILGGVAFTQGELVKTPDGINNGKTAPGVPEVTANLGGEVDIPFVVGLTATGRFIHTSSQFLDPANTQTIPSWTRVDLGARYATKIFNTPTTFRFNVENVGNAAYWASSVGGYLSLGASRRYLASVTAYF